MAHEAVRTAKGIDDPNQRVNTLGAVEKIRKEAEVVGMVYGVSLNARFGFAKPSTELRKILGKALK